MNNPRRLPRSPCAVAPPDAVANGNVNAPVGRLTRAQAKATERRSPKALQRARPVHQLRGDGEHPVRHVGRRAQPMM
jgi:hypothetical protein